MSLYAGISFDGSPDPGPTPGDPVSAAPEAAATVPPAAVTPAPTPDEPQPTAAPAWSAALRFAPVIRKKGPPPPKAALPTVVSGAAPASKTASQHALAAPTLSAPPTLYSSANPAASAPPTRFGRTLMKAPAMTLDDGDVNGFRNTAKGKKAAGKKNKGKKQGGKREDPALAFTGVAYDPARPCDYAAYKAHVRAIRTQRRLDREEELRRARRSDSGSGSSYYSGDSEEEQEKDTDQPANKRARFFAPPTSYNSPPPPSLDSPDEVPPPPPNPAHVPKVTETGDEAYARRLAMSARPPAPPMAPVAPPASFFPTFASASISSFTPSTESAPPPPPPTFIPPPFLPAGTGSSFAPPQPPPGFLPPPGFGHPPHPIAPPSTSEAMVSEATARARDIALRLSKLAAPAPPPVPDVPAEPDDRPFAQRIMSKYGWTQGSGLGAAESGMTSALSVAKPASAKKVKGKKGAEEDPQALPSAMAGRSLVVDTQRAERRAAEEAKMGGAPSRVVLLTNLCGVDDVDEELGGEVAEEANKFGVVERCVVWEVRGEVREDEMVRIFLVMSGLAGGYNAVKQFDGRFFGGRVVKARFYDEALFLAGNYTA